MPSLEPMTAEQLATVLGPMTDRYVSERIMSGEAPDDARRAAAAQTDELFPGGSPAPGQLLFSVVDGGAAVGWLWIGPRPGGGPDAYWVWNVEIDPDHRGRGLGRAAMRLAEDEARAHGATKLGLNVFAHNTVARRLYESIGYRPTAITMSKSLA